MADCQCGIPNCPGHPVVKDNGSEYLYLTPEQFERIKAANEAELKTTKDLIQTR